MTTKTLVVLLAAALLAADMARGADPRSPHPHQGKLKPCVPGKPALTLTKAQQSTVNEGKTVMSQSKDDGGTSGKATAVQAIHAPPRVVWRQLLDFNSYPKKVDKLAECSKYFEKTNLDGSKVIKARFLIKAAPGFSFEYFCDHLYHPGKKSLTWTLDYTRDSDFDDVTGHWYVMPHPTRPDWSQVYYSADLALKGWVPGVIMNILTNSALKSAVSWVKKFSEAEWAQEQAKQKASRFGAGGLSLPRFSMVKQVEEQPDETPLPEPTPLFRRPKVLVASAVTLVAASCASCKLFGGVCSCGSSGTDESSSGRPGK